MTRIRYSDHAIERYIERVRPAYDERQAFKEMQRLRDVGELVVDPPDWYYGDRGQADRFLVIGDLAVALVRIADPRADYLALTVAVRGDLPVLTRESRNQSRAGRGARKRARKIAERRMTKITTRRGRDDE